MSTRIKTLGATSLVIALALALPPTTAQAAPHYYKNNVLIGSEPVPVVEWGTLVEREHISALVCHDVIAESVENPEGGAAGTGETESFDPYGCSFNECPLESELSAALIAEALPWPNQLILEGSTLRQETTGEKLKTQCLQHETVVFSVNAVGSLQPEVLNGTSALHPRLLNFGEKSGELEIEGSKGTAKVLTEGKLKSLGYEEQELINAKRT